MDRKEEKLLEILKMADCPGVNKWTGEDLEWLWDVSEGSSAEHFLNWLCQSDNGSAITKDMILTQDEVQRWEALQASGVQILEGELLENALKTLDQDASTKTKDLIKMSEDEVALLAEEMADRLELQSATAEHLGQISNCLASQMTRNSSKLQKMQDLVDNTLDKKIKARQKAVADVNVKYNSSLNSLGTKIIEILDALADTKASNMISKLPLESLETEELKLLEAIEAFCKIRISQAETRGSKNEDRERNLVEISRLRRDFQESEKKRILTGSILAGAEAQRDSLQSSLQLFQQQNFDKEHPEEVKRESELLVKEIHQLQSELSQHFQSKVPKMAEASADQECQLVHINELKIQARQQKECLELLDEIRQLLLDQRCRQCLIEVLLLAEERSLKTLLQLLEVAKEKLYVQAKLEQERHDEAISKLKTFEKDKCRQDIVRLSDHLIRTALSILTDTDLDGKPIRLEEAKSMLTKFTLELKDLEARQEDKSTQIRNLYTDLYTFLPELKQLLHLDTKGRLTNPELSLKIRNFQSDLRAFEVQVKEVLGLWQKELKVEQSTPQLKTQKRIWIDAVNNPRLMEANVEAMKKKALSSLASSTK